MNKIRTSLIVLALCFTATASAQRRFYHRLDVGASNVYTFAVSNLVTSFANYFTHDMLFDNSYVYTVYGGRVNGATVKTKAYNPIGVSSSDLFNDAFAGVKLGYQSDLIGNFNWGIYASNHFRVNQFKAKFSDMDNYTKERVNYLKPGVGLLLTFGGIEKKAKVQVEVAARYDFPINYKGIFGSSTTDVLGKGVSTHYSMKVAGYSWFSAGAFADVCHYDLYKDNGAFKPYSFGVTFTITPKRGEDIYD